MVNLERRQGQINQLFKCLIVKLELKSIEKHFNLNQYYFKLILITKTKIIILQFHQLKKLSITFIISFTNFHKFSLYLPSFSIIF